MPLTANLRRLHGLRELEEEQCHADLQAGLAEERRFAAALNLARLRDREGRRQIVRSSDAPVDRIAGLVEQEAARRAVALLTRRLAECSRRIAQLRQLYLAKRVERRQIETLMQKADLHAADAKARSNQQSLDDWFGQRHHAIAQPERRKEEKLETEHADAMEINSESELRTNL